MKPPGAGSHALRAALAPLFLGLSAALSAASCPLPPLHPPFEQGRLILFEQAPIQLEVASSAAQRERGLMCRDTLAPDAGMLLRYPESQPLAIWMKNMAFSLDVLFLDDSGRILAIHPRVPPCREAPCPIYRSAEKARYALELPAGRSNALGMQPGQRLQLVLPRAD